MERIALRHLFPRFEDKLLEDLMSAGINKDFATGEEILHTGQQMNYALLVGKGLVKVFLVDKGGLELFLYYLKPGQGCAQSLAVQAGERRCIIRAKAAKPTHILSIPEPLAKTWIKKYASFNEFVLISYQELSGKLIQAIDSLAFCHVNDRLVHYLREYEKAFQCTRIDLTHAEIAEELNSSREVVSRTLKKLEEAGYIQLHHHHIEILRWEHL